MSHLSSYIIYSSRYQYIIINISILRCSPSKNIMLEYIVVYTQFNVSDWSVSITWSILLIWKLTRKNWTDKLSGRVKYSDWRHYLYKKYDLTVNYRKQSYVYILCDATRRTFRGYASFRGPAFFMSVVSKNFSLIYKWQ